MRLPNSPFLFLALFVSIALHAQLPPSGFTVISTPPIDDGNANYGQIPRLVLGANGSPLVSFLWRYPNGNLTNDTSTLYFTAWIPATNRWSTPVQVAVTGNTAVNGGSDVAQSLAYDASTNTIGIAYYPATDPNNIYIALSTNGGATWTSQAVDPNSLNTDHVPQYSPAPTRRVPLRIALTPGRWSGPGTACPSKQPPGIAFVATAGERALLAEEPELDHIGLTLTLLQRHPWIR